MVERRTVCGEIEGVYQLPGLCHLVYRVQPGDPRCGVEVGYAGGVSPQTVECLRRFRAGVDELVAQRLGEGVEYVGIDIVIEFLDGCPASESATYGYAFMYDVVECETKLLTDSDAES